MTSSLITPCARITPENWAVTMVKDDGCCHARILFEGVEDSGEQFVQMAHFSGEKSLSQKIQCFFYHGIGRVEMSKKWQKYDFKIDKYSSKTTTWIFSRDKIERLMKKIQGESGKAHPFFIAGKTSLLAKSAETYDLHDPILGELAKKDKGLFLKLYDSYCNEKKPTGMKEDEFNTVIAKIFDEDIQYDYQYFMRLFEQEKVTSKDTMEDSCFTWAKRQLKYLEIELEETKTFKGFAKIISVTSLQVFHRIQADGEYLVVDMTGDDSPMANIPMELEPISHRTVTHEKHRDKRTEAFKNVDEERKKISTKVRLGIGASLAGLFVYSTGVASTFGFIATAPVSFPVAIGAAILSSSAMVLSRVQASKLDKLQKKVSTSEEITKQETEKFEKDIHYHI